MPEPAAPPAKPSKPKWETDAYENVRSAIRKFSRPLQALVANDANEGDTRLVVTDILCEGLGYDKFEDLTTEYQVRGEFADYGIRIDKQLVAFVEVKRATQNLNPKHLRQVETYAVKEGLEWMVLTNGPEWQLYHVTAATGKPVDTNLVISVNLLGEETPSKKAEALFYFHKAAMKRDLVAELWRRRAATSPAAMADLLLSPVLLEAMRREIKRRSRYSPEPAELTQILRSGVIRPELIIS